MSNLYDEVYHIQNPTSLISCMLTVFTMRWSVRYLKPRIFDIMCAIMNWSITHISPISLIYHEFLYNEVVYLILRQISLICVP